jgi:hypothetical protein
MREIRTSGLMSGEGETGRQCSATAPFRDPTRRRLTASAHGAASRMHVGADRHATPECKKELLGFRTGMWESARSWKELLVDLTARGLSIASEIAVGDRALGF